MSLRTPQTKRAALLAIRRLIPGNTTTVQCERIRAALAQFSITTFEAMRYLDIYEDKPFDEARFADWVKQASKLPGEKM